MSLSVPELIDQGVGAADVLIGVGPGEAVSLHGVSGVEDLLGHDVQVGTAGSEGAAVGHGQLVQAGSVAADDQVDLVLSAQIQILQAVDLVGSPASQSG